MKINKGSLFNRQDSAYRDQIAVKRMRKRDKQQYNEYGINTGSKARPSSKQRSKSVQDLFNNKNDNNNNIKPNDILKCLTQSGKGNDSAYLSMSCSMIDNDEDASDSSNTFDENHHIKK